MNTRQMEIFVSIIRYGNFSNAAKKLYLSQPAVSANIDLLEKELESKLLIRQGRKATLTEKGKIFYDYCISVLGMTEKTVQLIKDSDEISGTLHIASSFVPGLYLLPKFMNEFKEVNPNLKFELNIKNSKTAYDGILSNKYDMGFVGSSSKNDCILQRKIFVDYMILIAPKISPYTEFPSELSLDDIKELPFLMRTIGSSTLSIAEKELAKKGIDIASLNTVASFDSGEAVIQGVLQNLGVAIISSICVDDNPNILKFQIKDVNMRRDFYAIIPNNEYLSPKVTSFYEFLPDLP